MNAMKSAAAEMGNLAAALVRAQAKAQAVGHDKTNTHFGFKYASAEAIITEARRALNAEGLAPEMTSWEIRREPVEWTDDEGKQRHDTEYTARITFSLTHESGESRLFGPLDMPAIPEKGRPLDKALNAALTNAMGYWLRGLLCLPRVGVDSDDVEQRAGDANYTPRRSSTASNGGPMANKYADTCHNCGFQVPVGAGHAAKGVNGWVVTHATEADCEKAGQPDARDNEKHWHAEIQLVIAQAGLSTTAAKPRRLELLRECFGTDSWKGVTAMPTDDLKQGLAKLKVALGRNEALAPAD